MSVLADEFIQAGIVQAANLQRAQEELRLAEQRRELEAAQSIAQAEKRRADQQARNNKRLFTLVLLLVAATVFSLIILNLALKAQRSAAANANIAEAQAATATHALGQADIRSTEAYIGKVTAQAAQIEAQNNREIADRQAVSARAKELAALAEANVDAQPGLAALLAVEAYRKEVNYETRKALFSAVHTNLPSGGSLHGPNEKLSGAFTDDPETVLVGTSAGLLKWNITTGVTQTVPLGDNPFPGLMRLQISHDGHFLFGHFGINYLNRYDLHSGAQLEVDLPIRLHSGLGYFTMGTEQDTVVGVYPGGGGLIAAHA